MSDSLSAWIFSRAALFVTGEGGEFLPRFTSKAISNSLRRAYLRNRRRRPGRVAVERANCLLLGRDGVPRAYLKVTRIEARRMTALGVRRILWRSFPLLAEARREPRPRVLRPRLDPVASL